MKRIALLWLPLGLALFVGINPAEAAEIFSTFLVRHAEKAPGGGGPGDPALSDCGRQRARHLATILAEIPIERIYSTDYRRTRETAAPLAGDRNLQVEIYSPDQLPQLAASLGERRQDTLVVGHSNTTAVLAGLLVGEQWPPFGEGIYDRAYQVVHAGSERRVYLLQQGFRCAINSPAEK
jgi:broad specificity phosphatase PhoE